MDILVPAGDVAELYASLSYEERFVVQAVVAAARQSPQEDGYGEPEWVRDAVAAAWQARIRHSSDMLRLSKNVFGAVVDGRARQRGALRRPVKSAYNAQTNTPASPSEES